MTKHCRCMLVSGNVFRALISIIFCCSNGVSIAAEAPAADSSTGATAPASGMLTPALLELENARIGDIRIINGNIFDVEDPKENRRLHRWANALHAKTRPDVIRTQLLFEPGDAYDKRVVKETERLLRSNRYLQDAKVVARNYEDGVIDIDIRTSDVWTLSPSISFGRGGGKNSGGIALKEYNLLGRGTSIGVGYKSNVDRDTIGFRYFDRNLFASRYRLDIDYADASDGYSQRFSLDQPFFALDTRRAGGASFKSGRLTESLYDRGEIASQYQHTFAQHEAYVGWSKGLRDNWSRRYVSGVGYNAHEFGLAPDSLSPDALIPPDRRFVYPFVGIELLQDDYETTRNFDQMNRTEDRHLGRRASFRFGYASRGLGSTANAWLYRGEFADTLYRSSSSTILVGANLDGRIEDGSSRNVKFSLTGRFDKRQSEKRLFHASLTASAGNKLDLDNPTYIGGDNGLRGYPLRYQGGDKSLLFSVEQRLFTDWYPYRLFNVGGAVFFDAGRTWGADPAAGQNLGWLRDVGVGLRIGSTRSGVGRMIHIDLAFPLDGGSDISNVQFLVEAKKGF